MRVTLAKGRSFWFGGRQFTFGVPAEVEDPQQFVYLTHTGRFIEEPPLSLPTVEFVGPRAPAAAQAPFGGALSFRRGERRRLPRYTAARLVARGTFREVSVAQVLGDKPDARVLVTRNMGLGDVLIVTAVLRELKRRFPQARITLATLPRYVPLLQGNPQLERAVPIGSEPGAGSFDVDADLCNWSETAPSHRTRHRADVFGEKLGLDCVPDRKPVYHVTEAERREAESVLRRVARPVVGLALRGSTRVRTYPLEHIGRLAKLLIAGGRSVVLLDHQPVVDWRGAGLVNLCGRTTIREAAALIERLDALVAPDSGLVHLAAAVGTPTVALFGSTPHELRVEGYPRCRAIQINTRIGCPPCFDAGCAEVACMARIGLEEIVAAVSEIQR